MTFEKWSLAACIVFSWMWSGLTAMLTLVMHLMLAAMNGRDFALFLRAFCHGEKDHWLISTS